MAASRKSRKADEAKQLRDHIRQLGNAFRDWVEQAMWPDGMTVAQLRLLHAVQMDPAASSAAIARQCQVTPQTLQAMLQRAVREDWLVRTPAARNARILTSSLTTKGAALLEKSKAYVAEVERHIWRDSSIAELEQMNAAFRKALVRMTETGQSTAPTLPRKSGGRPKQPQSADA